MRSCTASRRFREWVARSARNRASAGSFHQRRPFGGQERCRPSRSGGAVFRAAGGKDVHRPGARRSESRDGTHRPSHHARSSASHAHDGAPGRRPRGMVGISRGQALPRIDSTRGAHRDRKNTSNSRPSFRDGAPRGGRHVIRSSGEGSGYAAARTVLPTRPPYPLPLAVDGRRSDGSVAFGRGVGRMDRTANIVGRFDSRQA